MNVVPERTEGKIAAVLLLVFFLALNPPLVYLANRQTLVLGFAPLYLWAVAWGLFGTGVLVWAAWRDAFALTPDQVPPELRDEADVEGGEP